MVSKDKLIQMQQICRVIAQDMQDDATNFDVPKYSATVLPLKGFQGAAIQSLSKMIDVLLQDKIDVLDRLEQALNKVD
jgi:hypothetical protein